MKTPKKPNIYIIRTEKNQKTLYHQKDNQLCKCIIHKTEYLTATGHAKKKLKLMYLTKEIIYPNGIRYKEELIAVYRNERLLKITNKQELTKEKIYEMITKQKYPKQYT